MVISDVPEEIIQDLVGFVGSELDDALSEAGTKANSMQCALGQGLCSRFVDKECLEACEWVCPHNRTNSRDKLNIRQKDSHHLLNSSQVASGIFWRSSGILDRLASFASHLQYNKT